jgi:hypothetical protein
VQVLDLDARRRVRPQPLDDLAAVGGVRDEEHLVLAAHVGDEVVDDAAAGLVAAQGVLRLPGADLAQVVREPVIDEVDAAPPCPRTTPLPRWLTSNTPTASRTARCSLSTPPPGYSIGISHPPKSASHLRAEGDGVRSCSGLLRSVCSRSVD